MTGRKFEDRILKGLHKNPEPLDEMRFLNELTKLIPSSARIHELFSPRFIQWAKDTLLKERREEVNPGMDGSLDIMALWEMVNKERNAALQELTPCKKQIADLHYLHMHPSEAAQEITKLNDRYALLAEQFELLKKENQDRVERISITQRDLEKTKNELALAEAQAETNRKRLTTLQHNLKEARSKIEEIQHPVPPTSHSKIFVTRECMRHQHSVNVTLDMLSINKIGRAFTAHCPVDGCHSPVPITNWEVAKLMGLDDDERNNVVDIFRKRFELGSSDACKCTAHEEEIATLKRKLQEEHALLVQSTAANKRAIEVVEAGKEEVQKASNHIDSLNRQLTQYQNQAARISAESTPEEFPTLTFHSGKPDYRKIWWGVNAANQLIVNVIRDKKTGIIDVAATSTGKFTGIPDTPPEERL